MLESSLARALSIDLLPLLRPASSLGVVTPLAEGVMVEGGARPGAWAALARTAAPGPLRFRVDVEGRSGAMAICALRLDGSQTGARLVSAGDVLRIEIDAQGGAELQGLLISSASEDPAPSVLVRHAAAYASDYQRYPMGDVLERQLPLIAALRPAIGQALIDLDVQERFSLPQGLTLAALVRDFRPSVVLDLGTCTGGSAFSLALADPEIPIHTFDREIFWRSWVLEHVPNPPANITPQVCDLTTFDFRPLVQNAERVLIFWDAHGFEIAGRVFSHLLPLIADKPHLVVSHDISDNRFNATDEERSYGGRMMFRGYEHYDRNMGVTSRANLNWMTTAVDQGIALADFAWRNRIELSSVDYATKVEGSPSLRSGLTAALGGEILPIFDLTYFSMNQTYLRHFPSA